MKYLKKLLKLKLFEPLSENPTHLNYKLVRITVN